MDQLKLYALLGRNNFKNYGLYNEQHSTLPSFEVFLFPVLSKK